MKSFTFRKCFIIGDRMMDRLLNQSKQRFFNSQFFAKSTKGLLSISKINASVEKVDGIHWNIRKKLPSKIPSLLLVLVENNTLASFDRDIHEVLLQTEYHGEINVIKIKKNRTFQLFFQNKECFNSACG